MKKTLLMILVAVTALGTLAAKPKKRARTVDTEAILQRAEEALIMYDTEALQSAIDDWNEALSRTKGAERPERLQQLERKQIALSNMLQRVEQIVILDSIAVDAADFFTHYRLSPDAGRIGGNPEAPFTTFTPAGGGEIFYTAEDSGRLVVMRADILDDGTRDSAVNTGIAPLDSAGAAYPFMMADGITLYFASDADTDASLGGYDIYRTTRDETGNFMEPTNVGMPYNSPANDYLLAIDETTGAGWWATDRNAEDGKVTIYVFAPNPSRVNYDADREDIADLAFIADMRDTRPQGYDVAARLRAIDEAADADKNGGRAHEFELSLGDGRVYTSYADFRNAEARHLMKDVVDLQHVVDLYAKNLARLRSGYASGDHADALRIVQLESDLGDKQTELRRLRNRVIRLESR